MINLRIDTIGDGVVRVHLTSSDGGKVAWEDGKGYRVSGITRKFPVEFLANEGDEYFIADGEVKLIRQQADEFKASRGKGNN
jgi:hypothetical protein